MCQQIIIFFIQKVMNSEQKRICKQHMTDYDLIGNSKFCELNCLICCDCLRSQNNKHKYEGMIHKTITISQLSQHFEKLSHFSFQQLHKTIQKLDQYLNKLIKCLQNEIQQERNKLLEFVSNIFLTQITKDPYELTILQNLYHKKYDNLTCRQVASITNKLLSFSGEKISTGYQIFRDYIDHRDSTLEMEIKNSLQNNHYQTAILRDRISATDYPNFNQTAQTVQIEERVNTEESSPRKTTRILTRKIQKNATTLKDNHTEIKNLIEFKGSNIVRTVQQASFIERMFPNRIYRTKMLYKASENNYSVKSFHQMCDGQTDTIVFVKTEFNKIFGGFTTLPWKSANNIMNADNKRQSFIFSLSLKQKMPLVDEKSAIFNSINFGPTFGRGADFAICHNSHTEKTSYAQFPFSYANARYLQKNQHSTFLFTGQQVGNHFLIKQWEVWKLYFST